MKKLCFLLLSFVSMSSANALPVANPIDASLYKNGVWTCRSICEPCDPNFSCYDAFSLRVGFWGDYVFNRNMEEKIPGSNNQGNVETFTIIKNQAVMTLNWCNWLDVYGLVGAANFELLSPYNSTNTGNPELFTVLSNTALSYGGGARATLWECGNFGVGLEGQYFGFQPTIDNFVAFTRRTVNYLISDRDSKYNEWQVGLGAAYQIHAHVVDFIPYAAIKFAGASLKLDHPQMVSDFSFLGIPDLQNSRTVGYAIGTTVTFCDKGGMTVEGRFADETALFVNGQIRF
jgi:major outer membrane protein